MTQQHAILQIEYSGDSVARSLIQGRAKQIFQDGREHRPYRNVSWPRPMASRFCQTAAGIESTRRLVSV